MKRKLYQIAGFFLLLSVLLLAPSHPAQAKTMKGKWGKNISWNLNTKSGILVVSGYGDMKDAGYEYGPTPGWNKVKVYRKVKKLILRGNIKSIGEHNFYELYNLNSVKMCNTVERIGRYAFDGCMHLKKVRFSKNLKRIEYCAFADARLKELILPDRITVIEEEAFSMLEAQWRRVHLPRSLKRVGELAFAGINVKKLVIPPNVERIGVAAFTPQTGKKLKKVVIQSKKIKKIGAYGISNGNGRIKVIVPKDKYKEYKKMLRKQKLSKKNKIIAREM